MAKVNLEAIKPNSDEYRSAMAKNEEREHLKPLVAADSVVSTKPTLLRKLTSRFIKTDAKDIKNYVISEVIVPGLQNAFLDTIAMMFGKSVDSYDKDRRSGRKRNYSSSYKGTDYSSRSRRDDNRDYDRDDDRVDYRNIILKDRRDAEDIVNTMKDIIDEDGKVTVAQLLDLVGCESEFTDLRWGWTSPRDIRVTRVRSGFLIDVERARYVDD